jgi:uncharacterized iron-regulated membrane protein
MNEILGNLLLPAEQQKALNKFVNRFTRDHKPQWANLPWKDNKPYPVQFASDQDWLNHTLFIVTESGKLDEHIKYCFSNPTWPDNPGLREPNNLFCD